MVDFKSGILSGVISGILIGLFFKTIQAVTNVKIYTLLLNIDFIYNKPIPEVIEFTIHIAVSIVIGFVFVALSKRWKINNYPKLLFLSFTLTVPPIILCFPLTMFSFKETPAFNDEIAIVW